MVVWSTVETSCPICRHRLRVREVGGGFATGQDTDLLIRMDGKHVIQAEIHSCQNCKFSGLAEDFTSRTVTKTMVDRFVREVVDRLVDDSAQHARNWNPAVSRTPLPHVQHFWSALAGDALGLSAGEIGQRYLRAYWSLRLSPSRDLPEAELKVLRKRFLQEAIAHFRHGVRREANRVVVYLIGELCRRNGNFGLAEQYFDRFLYREEGPSYLKQAARKLQKAVRDGDASERTMEEVLYDANYDRRTRDRRPRE
ncbi:MAG TPA: DUF2225 domain-containing protein [Planctomycetota bacterium]|nr:DUF2225 domain-containing protein [Planctomycetota bacterium]